MNLYVYCGNDSINMTDPTGNCGYPGSSISHGIDIGLAAR
jgi:hypothetical protein